MKSLWRKICTLVLSLFLAFISSGQISEKYADEISKFYEKEIKFINLKSGDTLLDIGAGNGVFNALYSAIINNLHQVLTDIDKKQLNTKNVKLSAGNIKKTYKSENVFSHELFINLKDRIDLPSNSFNIILCRRSFHEFTEPDSKLKEMYRLLRDSGKVVVIEAIPNKPGQKDKNCKMPYLMPDKIINFFIENRFILESKKEEIMNFDDYGILSVLTFRKSFL